MSKVETQIDDAKKLALRCKTLELQLRQSVSKKDHNEITSKLEKQIDTLERDLDRARAENQKMVPLNKQIAGVEGLISSLIKTANAQGKTLDYIEEEASTRGKALSAQGKILDALATKISQGTVPSNVHLQSLSKIRDLEEDKRGMVRRFDYNSLEGRCAELSRQLGTMVPSADYSSLKEKFDDVTKQMENMVPASDYSALKLRVEELESTISSMVPRDQLASSETRVGELEARLAEHVPQSIYDELVSKVVSLAEAVTGGAIQPEETKAEPQPAEIGSQAEDAKGGDVLEVVLPQQEAIESEPPTQVVGELEATHEDVAPVAPEPSEQIVVGELEATKDVGVEQPVAEATEPSPPVDAPLPPGAAASESPVPEIREVASQLAEINSQTAEAKGGDVLEVVQPAEPQAPAVSETEMVVTTGTESVQVVESAPAAAPESVVKPDSTPAVEQTASASIEAAASEDDTS